MATRRLTLHPALIKPVLLAGGDRILTASLWTLVLALIFGAGICLLSIAVGLGLGIVGQFCLVQAAKADPLWFQVYLRSLQYKSFYRAHSSVHAKAARVRLSVPKV